MATKATPAFCEECAPAKINLTLRIRGRRADGYHELESLVVFADCGDELSLHPGEKLVLDVTGETAAQSGAPADNLVLKAAQHLCAQEPSLRMGHFHLTKQLPVAAGLGGGSSDAAAALRLIAQANPGRLAKDDARLFAAAKATGADVAVCLDPRPRIMCGVGDILSTPLHLPRLPALLVNPRVATPTRDVFAAYGKMTSAFTGGDDPATTLVEATTDSAGALTSKQLIEALHLSGNDLEDSAITLHPAIAQVLAHLRALPGCSLARMSGSGATCFALFETKQAAEKAAQKIAQGQPDWWVKPVTLG